MQHQLKSRVPKCQLVNSYASDTARFAARRVHDHTLEIQDESSIAIKKRAIGQLVSSSSSSLYFFYHRSKSFKWDSRGFLMILQVVLGVVICLCLPSWRWREMMRN